MMQMSNGPSNFIRREVSPRSALRNVAGCVDIAADDLGAFKAELERFAGGPLRADLDALLATGGHLDVIQSALDVLHVGDGNSKWLTMLGCVSTESDERVHPFPCAAT